MLRYENLYDFVFENYSSSDQLVIITGYIGPAIVEDLKNKPFDVEIYVGMYGNRINELIHNSLLKYDSEENINIYYTKSLVHAKSYIWKKHGDITKVLIGSANYSTSGLMTPFKEILGELPHTSYEQIIDYLKWVKESSFPVGEFIPGVRSIDSYVDELTHSVNENEVEISLLASTTGGSSNILGMITNPGDVHKAAGLNWGFSNGLPKPNDAYIKIPSQQIRNNPQMFPVKDSNYNLPIDVIWDDGEEMQLLLEGKQPGIGGDYPKQISSFKNKSLLGRYLRKRIGQAIGKDLIIPDISKEEFRQNVERYREKLITRDMLETYGRSSINIKLIGDRTYFFDFSNKRENIGLST